MNVKKGDYVSRISYGKDIIFIVDKIMDKEDKIIALLKGITLRIEADSDLDDLVIARKQEVDSNVRSIEDRFEKVVKKKSRSEDIRSAGIYNGKILHLDGETGIVNLYYFFKIRDIVQKPKKYWKLSQK